MTKNLPILDRTILCPKCQKKTMREAIPQKLNLEYFCDQCHNYFGLYELVLQWNYDLGDFYGSYTHDTYVPLCVSIGKAKVHKKMKKMVSNHWDCHSSEEWWNHDTVSIVDEPQFKSAKERDEAYEVVTRMFLDIPEFEEADDLYVWARGG